MTPWAMQGGAPACMTRKTLACRDGRRCDGFVLDGNIAHIHGFVLPADYAYFGLASSFQFVQRHIPPLQRRNGCNPNRVLAARLPHLTWSQKNTCGARTQGQ